MSSMIPMRALVRAAWQESLNQTWRFSPARAGLWLFLAQVGLVALAIWRLGGQPPVATVGPLLLFGAFQSALFAFLHLILRGRMQLFIGPVVQLIHLSPTPAGAAIGAEVLGQLPRRAWSALLFTAALSPALPADDRPWAAPLLGLILLLGGLLGHLAGLLALIAWVRIAPQSLGAVWILSMLAILAFSYYLAYLLMLGATAEAVAAAIQQAGGWFPAIFAILFGLPGLLMALRLLLSPRAAGEAYREAWLGLMELGDTAARPRRSRFPRLIPGPAGAVQALAWLIAMRNWMSLFRLGLWAACLAGIILAGPVLSRLDSDRQPLFLIGLGLGCGLLNYGEQVAALFAADGPRVSLLVVAGVRPGQLLLGKWLAATPLALVAALSAGTAALAARQPVGSALGFGALTLLIALASLAVLVGLAAFDAAPGGRSLAAESEQAAAVFEQVPTRLGGVAGLLGSLAVTGGALWLAAVNPFLLLPLALLPLAAAFVGYHRLRGLIRNGTEAR